MGKGVGYKLIETICKLYDQCRFDSKKGYSLCSSSNKEEETLKMEVIQFDNKQVEEEEEEKDG